MKQSEIDAGTIAARAIRPREYRPLGDPPTAETVKSQPEKLRGEIRPVLGAIR